MASSNRWINLSKTNWQQLSDGTGTVSVQLEDNRVGLQITASDAAPTGDVAFLNVGSADQIVTIGKGSVLWARGSGRIAVITVIE